VISEGGEWEIIEWFLKNKEYFIFQEGIFELHYMPEDKSEQLALTKKFYDFLRKKKYGIFFFNVGKVKTINSSEGMINAPNKMFSSKPHESVAIMCHFKKK